MKKWNWASAITVAAMIGTGACWAAAEVSPAPAAAAAKQSVKLALGEKAPPIDAVTLDGKPVTLATFAGKPLVLQFGSITEPVFRMRVAESEKLAAKYAGEATFVVIYSHESHSADGPTPLAVNADAGFALTAPVDEAQRVKTAADAASRLGIKNQQLIVDAWSNTSALRYGDYPNMTFLIDANGNLQAGYAWMDPAKVTGALDAVRAGKAVPAQFRGKTQPATPPDMNLVQGAQEMTTGPGGNLAIILDRMTLTDKQKTVLLPALADYLSQARDFRQKYGGGAALRQPPAAAPNASSTPGTGNDAKTVSPEEFAKALDSLRAAAQKLKTVCQQNLSEKDAKTLLDTLSQGPARRFFAQ